MRLWFLLHIFLSSSSQSSLCDIMYNPANQSTNASTDNPQATVISCHVQFAQPHIQLQVILTYLNAIHIYILIPYIPYAITVPSK